MADSLSDFVEQAQVEQEDRVFSVEDLIGDANLILGDIGRRVRTYHRFMVRVARSGDHPLALEAEKLLEQQGDLE